MRGVHPAAKAIPTRKGAQIAERLVRDVDAAVARQEGKVECPDEVQTEQDHEYAADSAHPFALTQEELPEQGRRRSKHQEHQRETRDEEERVDQRHAPRPLHVLEAEPRDEADVARDQRQDTG